MRTLLAMMLLCIAPRLASAHAILMVSQPAARAVVSAGPAHIVLRFNSRIDAARSRIELRGTPTTPAASAVLKLGPSAGPDTLVADEILRPGEWVLRWQVLAVDGHITRGDLPFTVK